MRNGVMTLSKAGPTRFLLAASFLSLDTAQTKLANPRKFEIRTFNAPPSGGSHQPRRRADLLFELLALQLCTQAMRPESQKPASSAKPQGVQASTAPSYSRPIQDRQEGAVRRHKGSPSLPPPIRGPSVLSKVLFGRSPCCKPPNISYIRTRAHGIQQGPKPTSRPQEAQRVPPKLSGVTLQRFDASEYILDTRETAWQALPVLT